MDDAHTHSNANATPNSGTEFPHTKPDTTSHGATPRISSFRKAFEEQEAGITPSLIPHKKPAQASPPTIDVLPSQYKTPSANPSTTASSSRQHTPRNKTSFAFALATVAIGATLAYVAFRHESETLATSSKEISR